jgi:cytochrome b subunit of formate dehydrogenase
VQKTGKKGSPKITRKDYLSLVFKQVSEFIKNPNKDKGKTLLQKVTVFPWEEGKKWIYIALSLSFICLGITGFLYTILIPGALRGYPLLFHVILGGVYSVCLAAVAVLHARFYNFEQKPDNLPIPIIKKILFWVFIVSGLVLMITALTSMLPLFSSRFQPDLIGWHRYSALLALLSAIAFVFLTQPEDRK